MNSHRALIGAFGVVLAAGCGSHKAASQNAATQLVSGSDGGSQTSGSDSGSQSSDSDSGSQSSDSDSGLQSSDSDGASQTSDSDSGSQTSDADAGAQIWDAGVPAVVIGAGGGTISAGGVQLTIPPGALTENAAITVSVSPESVPSGYAAYSPLYKFEPSGLQFALPVTVSIPFTVANDTANPSNDPRVATLFWSRSGATGYERTAAAINNGVATASVTHFSTGFVANGISYTDPPDPTCARTLPVTTQPVAKTSGLGLVFRVEDCQGRPLTTLGCGASSCDFQVVEDSAALAAAPVPLPKTGEQVFVTLVLDISSSVGADLGPMIEGAKAFVTRLQLDLKLPVHIGITTFWGEGYLYVCAPTLDSQTLLSDLDGIAKAGPQSNSDVYLNYAVTRALWNQPTAQKVFVNRNGGGAVAPGFIVLFTADADGGASTAVSGIQTAKATQPVTVATLSLKSASLDTPSLAEFTEFTDWFLPTSPDEASLYRDFSDLAGRIALASSAVYPIAFCTSQTSGSHTVAVNINGATTNNATPIGFTAQGSAGDCSASTLGNLCAAGQQCGGTFCGSCDDRTLICSTSNSPATCVSQCENMPKVCGGNSGTNALGYTQSCPDRQDAFTCKSGCVDLNTDIHNCGGCGNTCPGKCAGGVCDCSGLEYPMKWCEGACASYLDSMTDCGTCGTACADDQKCLQGLCKGDPEWANMPIPEAAITYDYKSNPDVVYDPSTGLTWQRAVINSSPQMTQSDAVKYCDTLVLESLGQHVWRLPTRYELLTLVNSGQVYPTIDGDAFPNTPTGDPSAKSYFTGKFWSSTITPLFQDFAYYAVDFGLGLAYLEDSNDSYFVRCVR